MNRILAKTVSEHQRDWDVRLSLPWQLFAPVDMTRTGYSPNFLVIGREVRAPPDIVYGSPNDKPDEDYDAFVERIRDQAVKVYSDVRISLQRSALRNKKYSDLALKPKQFEIGEWVLYFNPRKLRGISR